MTVQHVGCMSKQSLNVKREGLAPMLINSTQHVNFQFLITDTVNISISLFKSHQSKSLAAVRENSIDVETLQIIVQS